MNDKERDALCRRIDELCAENERLRQENQSIGMAAYELGRKSMVDENTKLREEIEAAKHDLQVFSMRSVQLDAENAKLREYAKLMHTHIKMCCDACGERGICDVDALTRKLGIEVNK